MSDPSRGDVYVTVAEQHSLGISRDNRLVYGPTNPGAGDTFKDLGPATTENIKSLIYALGRLKIHAIDHN